MKNKSSFLNLFFSFLFILVINACSNESTKIISKLQISPPVKNIDHHPQYSLINPEQGGEITTAKGSAYKIPQNAFVYEDGSLVTDSVKIEITEYRSASEILLSGIPMTCDSAGKSYNFESAGMFNITGECGNTKVLLAEGKSIEVDFASFQNGNYNFYYLNETTGKWDQKGVSEIKEKPSTLRFDTLDNATETPAPVQEIATIVEPNRINKNKSILDFDINLKNHPEVSMYNGVVWQYSDNSKFPDPDNSKWVFSTQWTDYELLQMANGDEYILKLKCVDKSFETSVIPVLSEKNYQKAMKVFKQNLEKFNEEKKKVQVELDRQMMEQSVIRTFSINELGIYNYDRLYKEEQYVALNADFKVDNKEISEGKEIIIFFITDEGRTVVKLYPQDWSRFAYNPSKENKIIAVLSGSKFAYFSSSDFKKINPEIFDASRNYVFNLKVSDKKISSTEELSDLLSSI